MKVISHKMLKVKVKGEVKDVPVGYANNFLKNKYARSNSW